MPLPSFTTTVTVDVEGDLTKSRWVGTFKIKRIITHQDRFDQEKYYRSYLASDAASDTLKMRATALAELRVRVVECPPWWEASSYGADLVDITPVYDLLAQCATATENWHKELSDLIKDKPKVEGINAS